MKNVGGIDFANLTTTLESSDPYISITDNSGVFGQLAVDSVKENTSDPYTLYADPSAPQGHSAEFRLIATEGAFADTFDFSFVIGSYHYMVWNVDPTAAPGMAMDSILTELGYTGNYSTNLLTDTDLEMYRALFVCVGIYPSNYVITSTSPEAAALVDYLTAGGNMYLEGGDVWYYDPLGSGYNFCPLFGINSTIDGTSDLGPVIGENTVFTEEMNFAYIGENSFIDHIDPTGTGFLIFHDGNDLYNCGVANDANAGYKTVGMSFELGGLVDAGGVSTKAALLDSIMHFFGITTGVEEITKLDVKTLSLNIAPNPFSKLTEIRFSILDAGYSIQKPKLRIYDTAGRLVKSFNLESSIQNQVSAISWHGDDNAGRTLPSGVYFVKLQTGEYSETRKVLLVR